MSTIAKRLRHVMYLKVFSIFRKGTFRTNKSKKKKYCLQLRVSRFSAFQFAHSLSTVASERFIHVVLAPCILITRFLRSSKNVTTEWSHDERNTNEHEITRAQWHGYSPFVTTGAERRKAGEVSDRVFNTRTLPRPVRRWSDTEWNSISKLTKERQPEAGRDSYSRACKGVGWRPTEKENHARVCFLRKASKLRIYVLTREKPAALGFGE